jgi:predicted Zn-dependent peptidase
MGIDFMHRTLGNGLTVIGEIDDRAHSAAAGFFVRTGARDEPPALMGVSHFLEHMMFKGTEAISADELNERFDDMGARHNAYTSNEVTCFYAQVLPEILPDAIDLLSTMMRPALREQDFTTEKQVILEEIAMYRDNPFWVLYEEAVDRYFAPHALAHRVLGTNETIGALTRDQMAGYFERRYAPDNMVLSLAGRVDFDRVCARVGEITADWRPTGAARDPAPPPANAESFALTDAGVARGYLIALAPAPAMDDERRYAAMILANLLGGEGNSRLHWALIETGLAEEAQAAYDPHEGAGAFMLYASAQPERLDEIRGVMEREIRALADSITETDLERIRNRVATAATVGGERPADRMQRIGRLWSALGIHRSLEQELERINAVTLDDLRALQSDFDPTPRLTAVLRPA